uniref:Uncharacterized protein n=1 Tax=Anopheles epiroticus TaxID=199890 RepID=A0A182PS20_9DIPT
PHERQVRRRHEVHPRCRRASLSGPCGSGQVRHLPHARRKRHESSLRSAATLAAATNATATVFSAAAAAAAATIPARPMSTGRRGGRSRLARYGKGGGECHPQLQHQKGSATVPVLYVPFETPSSTIVISSPSPSPSSIPIRAVPPPFWI